MCIDALILKIGRAPHNSENLARYKFGYFFGLSSILKKCETPHKYMIFAIVPYLLFLFDLGLVGGKGGREGVIAFRLLFQCSLDEMYSLRSFFSWS